MSTSRRRTAPDPGDAPAGAAPGRGGAGRAGWPAPRPVRPAGWWCDAALLAAVAALTIALAGGALLGLDVAVRDWALAHRTPAAHWSAMVLNYLGQGGPLLLLCLALAGWLARRRRSVRPLLPVAAAFLLTYLSVGPLKLWLDRGYPRNAELAQPERLFSDPVGGTAYPSGHVVNAVVWYAVLVLLLEWLRRTSGRPPLPTAARWWLRLLPPAVVCCTTVYLRHHWVTDAVAGLLIGLLLTRLWARCDWSALPLPARLADRRRAAGR